MPQSLLLFMLALGMGSPVFLSHFLSGGLVIGLCLCGVFFAAWKKVRPLGVFLFGFAIGHVNLHYQTNQQLPENLAGITIRATIDLDGLIDVDENGARFQARIKSSEHSHLVGKKLRLYWRDAPELSHGQLWDVSLRLRRPRGMVNPNGFDYQAWLLQRKIYATGYVYTSKKVVPATLLFDDNKQDIHRFRSDIIRFIDTKDFHYKALYRALLVGDKTKISKDQWRVFSATGTIHLMVISGLHIGLVAGVVFWLCGFLIAPFSRYLSHLHLRILPSLLSILAAGFYATLAGLSIPTLRATLLVILFNVAYIVYRKISFAFILMFAAVVVLLADPLAFMQPGFWLSFGAVFFLMYGFSCRYQEHNWWRKIASAQVLVFFALFVPLVSMNMMVSFNSPLANLVAVPVMSLLIVPLLFFAAMLISLCPLCSIFVFKVVDFFMHGLWQYLVWVDRIDGTINLQPPGSVLAILIGIVGTLLLLSPRALNVRLLGLCLLLVFLFPARDRDEKFSLTVLDVGQGLSVVFGNQKQQFVYDTGAKFSESFDMGTRIIAPYLNSEGVRNLEAIFISHADNDHIGGLNGLLSSHNSREISASEPNAVAQHANSPATFCGGGKVWIYDEIRIEAIWPYADVNVTDIKRNNRSCVLLIEVANKQILLTGDIEKKIERRLLADAKLPEDIDVLIAPHHGSNTSSTYSLIHRLSPKHVIFSAGYKNRYRHPAEKVVNRYQKVGSEQWITGNDGAISIKIYPNGQLIVYSERRRSPRPWFSEGPQFSVE